MWFKKISLLALLLVVLSCKSTKKTITSTKDSTSIRMERKVIEEQFSIADQDFSELTVITTTIKPTVIQVNGQERVYNQTHTTTQKAVRELTRGITASKRDCTAIATADSTRSTAKYDRATEGMEVVGEITTGLTKGLFTAIFGKIGQFILSVILLVILFILIASLSKKKSNP